MDKQVLEVSWRSIVRFFVVGMLILGLYFFRDLISIFLSAIVIATVAEGPVRKMVRRGWPRFAAVTLLYLGGLIFLGVLIYLFTPIVTEQFRGASTTLFDVVGRFFQAQGVGSDFVDQLQKNLLTALQGLGSGAGVAFGFLYRVVGGLLSVILAFVVSFYLALQGQTIERLIKAITRDNNREYFLNLWERSQRKIEKWFYGQVILSVFFGLLVFVGLWILGVNYSLLLGVLAAVLEIVPIVGPLITGMFTVVIAAHQGLDIAIWAVVLFAGIQQIENHIFVPSVMKRSIGLNPVVIVLVLLIGGKIAGFWGLLLAVPVTSALSELMQDWEERKIPT